MRKPAGLLSVPGRTEADSVARRAQACFADALVVHRLDMATSGLLLLARGAAAQRSMSIAFEQRRVDKTYVAIVDGLLRDDEGEIALPLAADWPRRPRQQVDLARGRPSLTRWRVLARDAASARSRIELRPVTGRSHQLRVHLAAIGHPIVGDEFYAPPAVHRAAPRLLLHATRLAFKHPASGADCRFDDAPPF